MGVVGGREVQTGPPTKLIGVGGGSSGADSSLQPLAAEVLTPGLEDGWFGGTTAPVRAPSRVREPNEVTVRSLCCHHHGDHTSPRVHGFDDGALGRRSPHRRPSHAGGSATGAATYCTWWDQVAIVSRVEEPTPSTAALRARSSRHRPCRTNATHGCGPAGRVGGVVVSGYVAGSGSPRVRSTRWCSGRGAGRSSAGGLEAVVGRGTVVTGSRWWSPRPARGCGGRCRSRGRVVRTAGNTHVRVARPDLFLHQSGRLVGVGGELLGEVQHRSDGDLGAGLLAPLPDLLGGDHGAGVLHLDHRCAGAGVRVDHDLAAAGCPPLEPEQAERPWTAHVRGERGVQGGGLAARVWSTARASARPSVAGDGTIPVGGDGAGWTSNAPLLGLGDPAAFGLGGVELGPRPFDLAVDLGERAPVRQRRGAGPRGRGVQGQGHGVSAILRAFHTGTSPATTRAQIRGRRWHSSTASPISRAPGSCFIPTASANSATADSSMVGAPSPATPGAASPHSTAGSVCLAGVQLRPMRRREGAARPRRSLIAAWCPGQRPAPARGGSGWWLPWIKPSRDHRTSRGSEPMVDRHVDTFKYGGRGRAGRRT